MELGEGQIYQGKVALSGADGPMRRWIVVAPFGKIHAHSIDNPINLHCLPASVIQLGCRQGRLQLVGYEPDHPILRLQRAKESLDIRDSHLGLHSESMDKMLALLEAAVTADEDYALYAAGEILALLKNVAYSAEEVVAIQAKVNTVLQSWEAAVL